MNNTSKAFINLSNSLVILNSTFSQVKSHLLIYRFLQYNTRLFQSSFTDRKIMQKSLFQEESSAMFHFCFKKVINLVHLYIYIATLE